MVQNYLIPLSLSDSNTATAKDVVAQSEDKHFKTHVYVWQTKESQTTYTYLGNSIKTIKDPTGFFNTLKTSRPGYLELAAKGKKKGTNKQINKNTLLKPNKLYVAATTSIRDLKHFCE